MKMTKKVLAIICVVALLAGVLSTVGYAAKADRDFTIVNPYADVDWSWDQYKSDLHTHTTASDGRDTLKDMLEINYKYGFDVYATSDHGLTSYSWTEQQVIPALKVFVDMRNPGTEMVSLNANGGLTFDGDRYDVVTENGGDYYYQTFEDGSQGQKMLRVPFANEQNPSSLNNAHVNTWFVDYGNGVLGGTSDYETPIKAVDELGGLSVINHPGEYTNARDEDCTADAYDYSDTMYKYYIDKFTNLLRDYPTCMGIDMNSKGDSRTRFDRKLWDILLMNLAPEGRNVLGIATSDAHSVEAAYTGYTMMLMPENTVDNLKTAMSTGAFFAASKKLGNNEELKEICNYLLENGDTEAKAIAEDVLARQVDDYNAKYEAPLDVEAPYINSVIVDDNADTIALDVTDDLCIRWIANGNTIAYGDSIDLDDYAANIGSYVRAEVFGVGGIVYTQAFLLEYDDAPVDTTEEDKDFRDFWEIASFIPDNLVRLLGSLDFFKIIWEALNG